MPNPPTFEQVCDEFRQFRYAIGKVMANTNEAGVREQLENLTRGMDENFTELLVAYPQAEAEFERRRVETKQSIQTVKRNAARVREEVAKAEKAKAAAAAAPKVPKTPNPPEPVDLKLGPKLRGELLERFAEHEDDDQNAAAHQVLEAWQDWDRNAWEKN